MPDAKPANAPSPLPVGGYPGMLAECRALGVPGACRRVLDDCLGHLDGQLQGPATGDNRRSARQTLRELADLIASDRLGLVRGDYQRLLARLAGIFAVGPTPAGRITLATTAPSYAGVVAAISRACPTCDYEAPLGQLLTYMARLFLDRRSGWKSIYRIIASMSDGVAAKRRLDEADFARLHDWIESGAANLFSIQRELARAVASLAEQVAALDAEIASHTAALELAARQRRLDEGRHNVVAFSALRQGRELAELKGRREDLQEQLAAKQGIKDLIDSDIGEIEDCLGATRRAYFVRLAYSSD